jgi:hypothetical protein
MFKEQNLSGGQKPEDCGPPNQKSAEPSSKKAAEEAFQKPARKITLVNRNLQSKNSTGTNPYPSTTENTPKPTTAKAATTHTPSSHTTTSLTSTSHTPTTRAKDTRSLTTVATSPPSTQPSSSLTHTHFSLTDEEPETTKPPTAGVIAKPPSAGATTKSPTAGVNTKTPVDGANKHLQQPPTIGAEEELPKPPSQFQFTTQEQKRGDYFVVTEDSVEEITPSQYHPSQANMRTFSQHSQGTKKWWSKKTGLKKTHTCCRWSKNSHVYELKTTNWWHKL